MTDLFAGIDPDGAIRFIGEVPRGAACGCWCPECSSPLIAKQGQLKSWHFAHEGGQERPECSVGAANLLRRLAIEHLKRRPTLEPPTYRHVVSGRVGAREWLERVDMASTRVAPWQWSDRPAKRAPVARSRLDDGVELSLHVDIADELEPTRQAGEAVLSFVLPLPGVESLQTRAAADDYVARSGRFHWVFRPDASGAIAAAQSRLERARMDAESEMRAEQERRNAAAAAADARAEAFAATCEDWAPQRMPKSSFLHYRLPDGGQWVVYTLRAGDAGVIAWPPQEQRAGTAPVGKFDEEVGVHRAAQTAAIMYFNGRRASLRTTSDIHELAAWSTT